MVLFLAANPVRLPRVHLDVECRTIEEKIQSAKFRDQIRFRSRWAVRPDDLLQGLNEDTPSVLHFSGHGLADEGICLESEDGSTVSVTADGLAQVICAAGASLKLVVLNACYSDVQARALAAHVPCVVGTPGAMGDRTAIVYAESFYRALAFGTSVADAHRQGLSALALQPVGALTRDVQLLGTPDTPDTPVPALLTRADIDASGVYLVQPTVSTSVDGSTPCAVEVHHLEAREGGTGAIVRVDRARPQRRSTVRSTEGEPSFIGRDEELRTIEGAFRDRQVVVLQGAPGIGKSRLALEYAHKHAGVYPGGMFSASFERPPPTELAKLLRAMGKPVYPSESIEEQCHRALADLGSLGRALLIYDAVADEQALRDWMPYGGLEWHLIVTSTFAGWGSSWRTVEIGALANRAAHELVSSILAETAAAVRLAEPIVVRAAGVTVELCASATAAYGRLLRGRSAEPLADELAKETIASFEKTWRLLSREARLVLRVASAFSTTPASAALIGSILRRAGWTSTAAEAAIDEVWARSLAVGGVQRVDVNPLVARFARDRQPLVDLRVQRALRQALIAGSDLVSDQLAGLELHVATDSAPQTREARPRRRGGRTRDASPQAPPREADLLEPGRQIITSTCDDLVGFIDGDLEPERAEAFREHLRSCADCQSAFVETLQMSVRLSELASTPAQAPPKPPAKYGQYVQWILAAAVVCTAAVGVLVLWPHNSSPPIAAPRSPSTDSSATDAFANVDGRLDVVRLAYADVSKHREIRQMRGSVGSSQRAISYDALAALQKANNLHGLAIAEAYNGKDLVEVAARLGGLPPTPEIRSDRAAIDTIIEAKDPAKRGTTLEALLEELVALKDKDDLAGRAARWNYALVLERLGLSLSAAQAFRAIAAEKEPGWSDEAARRAEVLARDGETTRTAWIAIRNAGDALSTSRTPIASDLLRQSPGLARAYFYNAVRTARSRDEVLALETMARELDSAGKPFLVNYVRRVAGLDFGQRKPIAEAYARLLKNELPPSATKQLLLDSPSPDIVDIVMGAMNQQRVVADHVDAYRRMVKQTDDPWFQLILADAEAQVAARAGKLGEVEARLREQSLCSSEAAIAYSFQCLNIASDLADFYVNQHRLPEAAKLVRDGMQLARRTGEWGQLEVLLWCLAQVARYDSSLESARAYANEILWMARKPDATTDEPSAMTREAHMILANLAIRDLNGPVARHELALALREATPDLWMANVLADVGRLDPAPGDLPRLQQWLNALRSQGAPSPTQRILFDAIEGRLLIDEDPAAGIAMLERVIASSDAIAAKEARSSSLSVLALEAARREDHARVLALLARQLRVVEPGACTVGMVVEDARDAIVVQGSDGKLRGTYTASRPPGGGPPAVSLELARSLESCSHVGVIAEGMLQGQPHVLPPAIAWSYLTGARRPTTPAPAELRVVIVANVKPPEDLQLPSLAPQSFASTSTTVLLSGLAATPARVLSEIASASEIQFHTHALENAGVSDASHLVLSPDRDRSYALTAEAIRNVELRGRPIVVLAACDSGHRARYRHVPFSLPSAFLFSGARMAFAAGSAIPDSEAKDFFARVLDSVHVGTDPAVALRDERQRVLAESPSSWVAEVVLFE